MLDKPTKDMEPAPGWRFPRFLRFGDNGDETAQPKAKKPPKEPEERKHHFAVWYVFAAFLGVMLIQYVWLFYTQVETVPYSQFEQLLNENKISEVLVGQDTIQGTLKPQPSPHFESPVNCNRRLAFQLIDARYASPAACECTNAIVVSKAAGCQFVLFVRLFPDRREKKRPNSGR